MLRNLIFIAILIVVSTILCAPVAAQKTFRSKAACETKLASGTYDVYEPTYFGLKETNPVNGTTKVAVALEDTGCYKELTINGKRWVIQKAGTMFRWEKKPDGTLVPYARDDCGNPIYAGDNSDAVDEIVQQTVSRGVTTPSTISESQAGSTASVVLNLTQPATQQAQQTVCTTFDAVDTSNGGKDIYSNCNGVRTKVGFVAANQVKASTCGKWAWHCWLPVATFVGGYLLGNLGDSGNVVAQGVNSQSTGLTF